MSEGGKKNEIYTYKILILGNSSVGKTSFLVRFCDGTFEEEAITTVGVDCKKKFIKRNNKNIKLNIMDTAGQERFRSIAKNMFKNADGIILMYDVTNEKSFIEIKDWISSIKEATDLEKIGLVIAGNKIDLKDEIVIDENRKKTFEEKQKLKIIETSAKSNINVDEVFIELIDKLQQLGLGVVQHSLSSGYGEEDEQNKTIKLDEAENNEPKKGCCKKNN